MKRSGLVNFPDFSTFAVQLTFLSAGGVVGGGVIASGEGSVAVRAAA